MRIEPLDLLAHADEAHAVQRAALATVREATGVDSGGDEQYYERHAARDGFLAVGAWDDGRLVGIAYGYRETPGSWWDGWVRPALEGVGEAHLLEGAFELVELHVAPERHGQGIGTRLLTALLEKVDAPRVLLSTQAGANPARGFYRSRGFREVAALPYGRVPFLVLARELAEPDRHEERASGAREAAAGPAGRPADMRVSRRMLGHYAGASPAPPEEPS